MGLGLGSRPFTPVIARVHPVDVIGHVNRSVLKRQYETGLQIPSSKLLLVLMCMRARPLAKASMADQVLGIHEAFVRAPAQAYLFIACYNHYYPPSLSKGMPHEPADNHRAMTRRAEIDNTSPPHWPWFLPMLRHGDGPPQLTIADMVVPF